MQNTNKNAVDVCATPYIRNVMKSDNFNEKQK